MHSKTAWTIISWHVFVSLACDDIKQKGKNHQKKKWQHNTTYQSDFSHLDSMSTHYTDRRANDSTMEISTDHDLSCTIRTGRKNSLEHVVVVVHCCCFHLMTMTMMMTMMMTIFCRVRVHDSWHDKSRDSKWLAQRGQYRSRWWTRREMVMGMIRWPMVPLVAAAVAAFVATVGLWAGRAEWTRNQSWWWCVFCLFWFGLCFRSPDVGKIKSEKSERSRHEQHHRQW